MVLVVVVVLDAMYLAGRGLGDGGGACIHVNDNYKLT